MEDVKVKWKYCRLCLILYINAEVSFESLQVLSWDAKVCVVGCGAFCFSDPALVKCLGNNLWYLLRGIVLTSVPVSILMGRDLLPWMVIICSEVWNEVCPSDMGSVMSKLFMT